MNFRMDRARFALLLLSLNIFRLSAAAFFAPAFREIFQDFDALVVQPGGDGDHAVFRRALRDNILRGIFLEHGHRQKFTSPPIG